MLTCLYQALLDGYVDKASDDDAQRIRLRGQLPKIVSEMRNDLLCSRSDLQVWDLRMRVEPSAMVLWALRDDAERGVSQQNHQPKPQPSLGLTLVCIYRTGCACSEARYCTMGKAPLL